MIDKYRTQLKIWAVKGKPNFVKNELRINISRSEVSWSGTRSSGTKEGGGATQAHWVGSVGGDKKSKCKKGIPQNYKVGRQ